MDPVAIDRIRANIDLANAMSSDNLAPADQQYIDVIQNFTRAQGFTSTPTPNFAQRALLAGKESWKASLNYFDAVMQDKIGNREGYISAMTSAADKQVLAKGMRDAEGIKSFETLLDDGSAGDWLKYFAFTGLETAPHIAATFASAGAGLTVGAGLKGLRALAARKAKSLAQDKFIRNASLYSAFAHEYAVGTGETMGFTGDSNASLIAGAPYAAANLYATVALSAGILKQAVGTPAEKQARTYFQRVLAQTARGAALEGVTEAFQAEVQLLAKAATDPNFDINSADANMMRLEAAVAGTVLGGTISGAGSSITAPFAGPTGNFRAGAQQADQDFQEGMDSVNQGPVQGELDLEPREPESGFIPETDEQIATQLKELIDGRGREAVQLTNQTMDPEKLAEIGLQQIELDAPEQGVLIVRADQDAAEIKAAFQSGSRDVLGNGTINKPTQMDMFDGEETQVVRSVNSDGSRGADVVVTPDTEAAVTAAQEAKSDVGKTEKVTAKEAAKKRVADDIDFPDEILDALEVDALDGNERPDSFETQEQEAQNQGLSIVDEEIDTAAQELRKMASGARGTAGVERSDGNRGPRLYQVAALKSFFESADFNNEAPPAGRTYQAGKKKVPLRPAMKEVIGFVSPEQKKARDEKGKLLKDENGKQILVDGQNEVEIFDLKALAMAGWRQLQKDGATAKTTREMLEPGLTQAYGTLALAGYVPVEQGAYGGFNLALTPDKRFGRGDKSVPVSPELARTVNDGFSREAATQGVEMQAYDEFGRPIEGQTSQLPSIDAMSRRGADNNRRAPQVDMDSAVEINRRIVTDAGESPPRRRIVNIDTPDARIETLSGPRGDQLRNAQGVAALTLPTYQRNAGTGGPDDSTVNIVESERLTNPDGSDRFIPIDDQAEIERGENQFDDGPEPARRNDSEIISNANNERRFETWNRVAAIASPTANVKIATGSKLGDPTIAMIKNLANAIKLTDTKVLIIDSDSADAFLRKENKVEGEPTRQRIDENFRSVVYDAVRGNPMGRSIVDPTLGYGVVFINTRKINSLKNKVGRKFVPKSKAEKAALTAWTISHELGHQYFRSTIAALPKADKAALYTLFNQDESRQWYLDQYAIRDEDGNVVSQDPAQAANEWFADRIAAVNMKIIGRRRVAVLPFDDSTVAGKAMNKVAASIAAVFDAIFKVWQTKFATDKRRPMHSNPAFNSWLTNAVRRKDQAIREAVSIKETEREQLRTQEYNRDPSTDLFPLDDESVAAQEQLDALRSKPLELDKEIYRAKTGRATERKVDDFDLDQFIDDYNIPRNRIQFEQTAQTAYEKGVGSMLGKLFFSAHEQLSVMGPAGKRLADMLYKKSSTVGRGGFINKADRAYQSAIGTLYERLPKDKETMTQVLDEYAVWRENGADMNNIPPAIRRYHRTLSQFFDRMAQYAARANPDFRDRIRENYFPHMYDPEKLNDPQKQEALAQLVLAKHPDLYQDSGIEGARQSVRGLRAGLSARTQSPDPKGVTAHSAEQRTWTNLTYGELKELNVLYDVRGAVFKYAREMTRMAEFNRMFGEQRTQMDRNGNLYETWQPDQKIRTAIEQLPEEKQAQARVIVDGMLGRLGKKANPQWTEAQSWMMSLQFMATLSFATLASLPDIMMPALRSREFSGLAENINQITKMLSKEGRQEMYELAYTTGAVSTDLVHESIISGYGSEWMSSKPRKVTDTFFKVIGLEQWTRMTRVIATSFAKDFLIKHATQPNARSERYLAELEIDAPTIQAWLNSDQNFDSPEGRRVKIAMLNFTDEAVLRPNAAERPTYMSDPRFMIFGQLKGFFYSFGQKVVGGLYREMQSRQAAGESISSSMTPMLLASVALMPLAAVALSIREGIKYEEGEAPTDEMNIPEYMFEVMTRAGFLGPLEIPRAMFQAEQYGQPFWAAPLGPTVGTGLDLVNSKGFSGLEGLLPAYNTGIYN